jgi:hypothetical protein
VEDALGAVGAQGREVIRSGAKYNGNGLGSKRFSALGTVLNRFKSGLLERSVPSFCKNEDHGAGIK